MRFSLEESLFVNINTIKEIAETLAALLGKPELVKVNKEFRKGDIRHCYADISKAKKLLGWKPKISLEVGLKELIQWSSDEKAVDRFNTAEKELRKRGIL